MTPTDLNAKKKPKLDELPDAPLIIIHAFYCEIVCLAKPTHRAPPPQCSGSFSLILLQPTASRLNIFIEKMSPIMARRAGEDPRAPGALVLTPENGVIFPPGATVNTA